MNLLSFACAGFSTVGAFLDEKTLP